ncbi:MAG TPA: carboxysome shell carbonic anhydrase [bacterium]|nr:carboxysome shell carbonic anhydrase [bacterium]
MQFTKLANHSIEEKVKAILQRNEEYSDKFRKSALQRRQNQEQHSTAIAAFKCMDGRVHLPILTSLPLGIIKPFRSLGGKFNLAWPYLDAKFKKWVKEQVENKKECLVLVTYHFSEGNADHGCAGFGCDVEAARTYVQKFKEQIVRTYHDYPRKIFPIIVGIETDSHSLLLHTDDGQIIKVSDLQDKTKEAIYIKLVDSYKNLSEQVSVDLLELVVGNIKHMKEVAYEKREAQDYEHKEWTVGFGTGFDWLHAYNTALIVGPWSPRMDQDLLTAFSIIKKNMDEGRISDDGFIVLLSTEKNEHDNDDQAIEKVNFLQQFAKNTLINSSYSSLLEKAYFLPVSIDGSGKFTDLSERLRDFPQF